ncbi:Short-chain dehydrogenase [Singulisphaera sp. GP187]|uniref:SDR family NAD(P)-dependent oxidoreductase n=1 Tax=Singulisphaera sp. GP187 TaxID=1882752 RepID=UPI000926ECEA|nr:SDR family NAD(P)-dependent oxidoreductase [Singulisphaera sp. GP187]SIO62348.1 Short-chain dehydrogenase [Singulisphaera sp. GP187]
MARRRNWNDARCLVTGASSGLGCAMAQHLVRAGARVVLTGRSSTKLDAIKNALVESGADPRSVLTQAADLTKASDRARLVEFTTERLGALDLAINSAGVGATGHFETHDPSVLRQLFEINVFALAELSRLLLPVLAQGNRPSLINVGSIVARRGLPGRAEYTASKFAVAGFTESIRAEWSKYGIHILLLNPGFTATEFERNLIIDTARFSVTKQRRMTADTVADAALRAALGGRNELTLTTGGRFLLLANRVIPRIIDWGFKCWTLHLFPDAPILQRPPTQSSPSPRAEGTPFPSRPHSRRPERQGESKHQRASSD